MCPKPKMVSPRGVGPICRGATRGDNVARRLEHVTRALGTRPSAAFNSEANELKMIKERLKYVPHVS